MRFPSHRGIPHHARPDEDHDIRLGGVVVSHPNGTHDLIKAKSSDKREGKGFLRQPPMALLNVLASIQTYHEWKDSKVPCFTFSSGKTLPENIWYDRVPPA